MSKQFEETFDNAQWKKPNKCNQSNYALFNAGDLRKHLKTHCGEKSNKCNRCDYTLELITFEILAADRLRLMEFDNRLIGDYFANIVILLI